jgi:hypothetical protein
MIKGSRMTEEQRKRVGLGHIGFKHTEESKSKMSIARLGIKNPFYGKKHTEETKEKIYNKLKNRIFTIEHRRKLSIANIGKKRWLGKHCSLEHRKKCSETKK